MPFRSRFLRLAAAILALGSTAEIASAFCSGAPPVVITMTPQQGAVVSKRPSSSWPSSPMTVVPPMLVRRSSSSSHRSLHVLQSAKIIPYAFRSVGVALAYKAFKLQLQTRTMDAIAVLATGLMSCFNFAIKDNDRLKSAKRAVKRFADHSEDELERDAEIVSAAKTWKSAVRVKLVSEFLSLLGMVAAKTHRNLYLGATAVVGSTIVFLLMGGGRFQHNGSGRLNPVADDFISKAYALDGSIAVAALLAAFGETGVVRQVCAGYVAFGYFGAALQGMAPKSKAKKKLNKAVFGKSASKPSDSTEPKSEEE